MSDVLGSASNRTEPDAPGNRSDNRAPLLSNRRAEGCFLRPQNLFRIREACAVAAKVVTCEAVTCSFLVLLLQLARDICIIAGATAVRRDTEVSRLERSRDAPRAPWAAGVGGMGHY